VTENGGALSLTISGVLDEKPLSGFTHAPAEVFWFAVQTRPRHEKKVNSGLGDKGIQSFLPLFPERRRWSDRYQWVDTPVFSQYLFVRLPMSLESRVRVLQTAGVVQFVGALGKGTPIPDEQIENLRTIVAQRIPIRVHEFLRVGERVRIRGGALDGIEGILAEVKNDKSLVISIDLIEKSLAIRIQGFEVEPV
jgi:transcription termination/antitermination protein NusG